MSENRNGKFKKYSSHPRRRSRSTEAPESSNSRDDTVDGENLIFPGNSFTNPVSPRNDDFPDGVITRNVSSQGDNKTISEDDAHDKRQETGVLPSSSNLPSKPMECAICLQPCVHPARLPCTHVFCFLCLKGIARGPHTCAMCRAPIPQDYTDNPDLVPIPQEVKEDCDDSDKYTWFYEGRNGSGWWQYDARTSTELEQCFQRGDNKTEVLIAGYLYTVDLTEMMQARKNEPARRRAIKRDLISSPKKGIAGLRQPVLSGLTEAMSRLNISN